MIVRILGEGQLEVDDAVADELNKLDARLEAALNSGDEAAFRPALAAMLAVASVVWLYLVIRRHGRVTTGTLVTTRQNGTWNIETQAFLSWVCVTWLILTVCQIIVTLAGNLRVLPLTGITYPFVSFGKTSLWVNAVLLGLSMTVDIRARPAARKS